MTNVNDLLRDHVTLTVDCMDRIYLNGYIPNLQVPGELVSFLTKHRGHPIPSPVVLAENPHPLKDPLLRIDNLFGLFGLISKSLSGRRLSARTGLAGRHLIVAANDQGVTSVDDLHRFLAEWPINGSVALTLVRGQDRLTVEVTPVEAR